TFNDVKERIINLVDDDNNEEDIKISEEDIVISKSFDDEGDVN
ncbi:TPA: YtxH domain-containing protein, partial [Clostridioides difficile]|nr:YtxH domain-containing protein [Clostridioides difficile]